MDIDHSKEIAFRFYEAGDLEKAEAVCIDILEHHPDASDILYLFGDIHCRLGKFESAMKHLKKALELESDNALGYRMLGFLIHMQGNPAKASEYYRKAISLDPHNIDDYYNLGLALHDSDQFDEAIENYKLVLQVNPNDSVVLNNLGLALYKKGFIDDAIAHLQRAVQINPTMAKATNNLGLALHKKGFFDEAISSYKRALSIEPHNAEILCNIANSFFEKGLLNDAQVFYERAIQAEPEFDDAYANIGNIYQEYALFDKAIIFYNQALKINPNNVTAHWCKATAFLTLGNFHEGWREYEWRWQLEDALQRNFSFPRWDGSDITGQRILLYAEQGFGDTIQFIRYATLVTDKGGKVIFEGPKELKKLLQSVNGIGQIIASSDAVPDFDVHCPLLSLPLLFKTNLDTIPANIPYIAANPDLVNIWRTRLQHDDTKLKIGIVWSGNSRHRKDRQRSVSLDCFAPLAGIRDISLYSLQKGEASQQVQVSRHNISLFDYTDEINNFEDTAALIMCLDLIITVDTSVAHLAGALGKPVWTLLPFSPDWRWMLNRDDSPWYPTMRLFRQVTQGDWESVISIIVEELNEFVNT